MLRKIIFGLLALLCLIGLIGVFLPSERIVEGEFLIKEPVDQFAERLNDDLLLAQWMTTATGKNIQTVEQEGSRGRGYGRLKVKNADLPSVAATIAVDFYKPVNYVVESNIYLTHTDEGTSVMTFSTVRTSGVHRFFSWLFNPASRWESALSETMEELKAEAESSFLALINGYYIQEKNAIERIYLLVRRRVPFAKMNEFSLSEFPGLDQFVQRRNLQRFPFSTFYYNLHMEDEMADIAAAIRINRDVEVPSNITIHYHRRGKVIYARHYGHVDKAVNAHAAVRVYLEDMNLLYDPPFIETYEVGVNTTENPDEWVTLVEYFLVE